MAVGDLSPDQNDYARRVASSTGLDLSVIAAWIGSESGWGVHKNDHNYLNIGPGRRYSSTEQAAGAAASLVNSSSYYKGIRSAIPQGPAAQVAAIEASPWDAGRYGGNEHRLAKVWQSLSGKDAAINVTGPSGVVTNVDFRLPGTDIHLPTPADLVKGATNTVQTGLEKVVNTAIAAVGSALLSLAFVAGALALIGLGLARLTGRDAKDLFSHLSQVQAQAGQAATIAAMA